MADTQTADTTQQVTSQIPMATPSQKNPKRVAAGKAIAEKRRQAREEQNKEIAEMSQFFARLAMKYGMVHAITSAVMITTKHVELNKNYSVINHGRHTNCGYNSTGHFTNPDRKSESKKSKARSRWQSSR